MTALVFVVFAMALIPIGLLAAGAVYLVRRLRFSVPGAIGADARELRAYVHTFARTLSTLGVSRAARSRHVDELKANLAESVAADGARVALAGLGPAGALATGYADYRARPAWLVGVGAAVLTFAVTWFVHLQYANAYAEGLSGLQVITGTPVEGTVGTMDHWAVRFSAVMHGGPDVDASATSPWLWLLPIATFFIASRSWRALALRNAATVKV